MKVVLPVEYWPRSITWGLASKSLSVCNLPTRTHVSQPVHPCISKSWQLVQVLKSEGNSADQYGWDKVIEMVSNFQGLELLNIKFLQPINYGCHQLCWYWLQKLTLFECCKQQGKIMLWQGNKNLQVHRCFLLFRVVNYVEPWVQP
jgi:hypothetical protein